MVQSNKKLKQALRAAKAELLAASEVQINPTNVEDPNSKSVKSLLNSMTRLSKRDKRREKARDGQKEVGAGGMSQEIKEKHKKRKRDEIGGLEKDNEELKQERKPMKKKKNKKKNNKGKQRVEDGEVTEGMKLGDGGNGEAAAAEIAKWEERLKQRLREPWHWMVLIWVDCS